MDQIKRRHAAALKHVQASTPALNRVDRFTHLDKGFSPDVKFIGWEHDTPRFLIRFADVDRQEILQAEFEILAIGRNAHIPCPDPIRFGITVDEKTCYSVVSYILGEGADRVLPTLSVDRQFQLGVDTGRILQKTHHISPAHEAHKVYK